MNIYQKQKILLLGFGVVFGCFFLFSKILPEEFRLYADLLLFGLWFLWYIKWWRCPYCLRSLGRFQFPIIHCPFCGKDIPKNGS